MALLPASRADEFAEKNYKANAAAEIYGGRSGEKAAPNVLLISIGHMPARGSSELLRLQSADDAQHRCRSSRSRDVQNGNDARSFDYSST